MRKILLTFFAFVASVNFSMPLKAESYVTWDNSQLNFYIHGGESHEDQGVRLTAEMGTFINRRFIIP